MWPAFDGPNTNCNHNIKTCTLYKPVHWNYMFNWVKTYRKYLAQPRPPKKYPVSGLLAHRLRPACRHLNICFAMKRCPIVAKIAGLIGILLCASPHRFWSQPTCTVWPETEDFFGPNMMKLCFGRPGGWDSTTYKYNVTFMATVKYSQEVFLWPLCTVHTL